MLLALTLHKQTYARFVHLGLLNGCRGHHPDVALLEGPQQRLGDILVFAGEELGTARDQRHLHAESAEEGREFAADGAASDNRNRGRQRRELKELRAGDDASAVERQQRHFAHRRTRCDDALLKSDRLAVDLEGVGIDKRGRAVEQLDPRLLELPDDPRTELVFKRHRFFDELPHLEPLEEQIDTAAAEIGGFRDIFGALEVGLGRDAPLVQAGAADALHVPVDQQGLDAPFCELDGRFVASGPRTDHHRFILFHFASRYSWAI